MIDPAAIRRVITDVEQAVCTAHDAGGAAGFDATAALARLYTVYAQSVLRSHGVTVDLEELCRRPWGTNPQLHR